LLDADRMGSGRDNDMIQSGKILEFMGSSVPISGGRSGENPYITHSCFIPKDTDFNSSNIFSDPTAYFVARVKVVDTLPEVNGDIMVYLDTEDGTTIGPFPSPNLMQYTSDLIFNGDPRIRLLSGTDDSFDQEAYTYWGAYLKIYPPEDAAMAEIRMP